MATNNNLTDFVTSIATVIRNTDSTSDPIDPQTFVTRIVNYQAKTVNSSTSAQTVTADSGYMALSSVKVNAMATGSAKGNAGTITYKSIAQDSSNKKKFTITGTVTAPAPTVSAGYISSGTAGTSTDRTVAITLTDAQAQAAVGSASVSAYFNDGDSLSNYFNAGTSTDYNVGITYGDTVSTAGYTSEDHKHTVFYKIKTGSATTPATSITANPGTPTWNSTNSNYVISVSATKNVTPTVSAGWVGSGTAGTITVSGSSTLAQSTWAGGTAPSGVTPTSLAKNTTYKLSAGYYPSDRYYKTQADPTLSGDAGAANVLSGKTFYSNSYTKATGTMPSNSNGIVAASMAKDSTGVYAYFPYGYYPQYSTTGYGYIYFTKGNSNLIGSAAQSEVLKDKTFTSSAGVKLSGTMTNNGAIAATQNPTFSGATASYSYTVPAGYHNGSGTVSGSVTMGNASISAYFDDDDTMSTYFDAGTSSAYNVAISYGDTVSTAGYASGNSRGTKWYQIKSGSATTPTASGASTSTSLSGTTLTVARSVTPTVSTGWVTSGTAGTVTITGTVPTETKAASGSGDITPSSGKLLSKVTVGAGSATPSATVAGSSSALSSTTTMNNQYFTVTPKASVGTAGWIASISNGSAVNYKVKDGSATGSFTLTELSSTSSSLTTVSKQLFSVQGKGSVSTAGWISSVGNGTTTYYKVKDGSATTPSGSGAASVTSLSGTTLTVSRIVTPTVSAGWVSSGTAGTVTITGTVPTQSKTATPTGSEQTISPDSGKLLSSVTVNPPVIKGTCKYKVYTTENRLITGNSTISPVNLTLDTLDSSKTYNIIVMLSGYGWGPTSTSAPNTGAILGLYNVPGNSFPSSVTASETFNANGFANGSHTAGTFTVSVGVYNSTTLRIVTSASGLTNAYNGAAYVDVKMVIVQEV